MAGPVLLGAALRVPVDLGRDEARRAARRELSRPAYQADRPGPIQRLAGWLLERLQDLLDRAAGLSPGGRAGLLLVVAVLVAAALALRLGIGPVARAGVADVSLFVGRVRSAAEHRRAADTQAQAGRWEEAVRERFRAVVRELEQRGLLDPRPGRTADEAAAEGSRALPGVAAGLAAGAQAFDDVCYGGLPATAETDAALRELDARVQAV